MCYIINNRPTEAHCWNCVEICVKLYLLINALHIQIVSIYSKNGMEGKAFQSIMQVLHSSKVLQFPVTL